MKFVGTPLLLLGLGFANAEINKPQLSIKVRDGTFGGLGEGLGLDPTLSWESSNDAGDVNLSYGIEASLRATNDITTLPRSIWGKAKTDISGWGVSARAEVEGGDFQSANLDLDAENEELDLALRLQASAGKEFSVQQVEATKGFAAKGARVTVTPRYNLENDERDVVISYANDKTNVKLTASVENQEVTISQQLDDVNRIAPTVSSNGDVSLEWERRLSGDSSLRANLKPNNSLDVEWKDSAWTANVVLPIDGANVNGANVSIKRDVTF